VDVRIPGNGFELSLLPVLQKLDLENFNPCIFFTDFQKPSEHDGLGPVILLHRRFWPDSDRRRRSMTGEGEENPRPQKPRTGNRYKAQDDKSFARIDMTAAREDKDARLRLLAREYVLAGGVALL
jgi:hypothetical protein